MELISAIRLLRYSESASSALAVLASAEAPNPALATISTATTFCIPNGYQKTGDSRQSCNPSLDFGVVYNPGSQASHHPRPSSTYQEEFLHRVRSQP